MKKSALILIGALAAVAVGVFPAVTAAHEGPGDAVAIATALKNPLLVKGNASVTIVHLQKGCHSWSLGRGAPAPGVKVVLKRGQRVTILNQDVDMHRLVRIAGPRLALGKAMATSDRRTLTFSTPGVYKLHTHRVEMPGMAEVETGGPAHVLAMLVVVR